MARNPYPAAGEELLVFRKFMMDMAGDQSVPYLQAAIEKLHTLFPDKQVVAYDELTIGVETDSLYSDTGIDTYEIGLLDGEIPAIRCQRDDRIITFRL